MGIGPTMRSRHEKEGPVESDDVFDVIVIGAGPVGDQPQSKEQTG
jgi:hypothetical protein